MTGTAVIRRRPTEVAGLVDRMPMLAVPKTPPLRVNHLILWLFVLGFGMFGVLGTWAATASIKGAVVATGLFRVLGDNLVVQHLEGGIVREILVKEGSLVAKGDVIARLDDTRAGANLAILSNQLAGALATESRLLAEFQEADRITIPDELAQMIAAEPSFASLLDTQRDVFDSSRQLSIGQVQILEDRIQQLSRQSQGVNHRVTALGDQLTMLQEELKGVSALYEQKLVTKAQYLALRREETALMGDIGVAQTQLQTVEQQIAEIEERKLQVRRDRLIEITADRQAVSESIFDIRQRIDAARDVRERLTLRAPQSGRVMDLQINTVGEVIASGAKLLEIVPSDGNFVIEVKVSPNDINQVFEGGEARVRLTAYNYRTTPIVKGVVTQVSADSFTDQRSGQTYFLADVRVLEGETDALPSVEMLLGMPAQVMIATGEQTLGDYLLQPIIGGMEVALSESE